MAVRFAGRVSWIVSKKDRAKTTKHDEDAQVDVRVGRDLVDARCPHGRRDDAAECDVERDDAQCVAAGQPHQFPLVPVGLLDEVGQGDGDEREDAGRDEGEQARAEGGEEEECKGTGSEKRQEKEGGGTPPLRMQRRRGAIHRALC